MTKRTVDASIWLRGASNDSQAELDRRLYGEPRTEPEPPKIVFSRQDIVKPPSHVRERIRYARDMYGFSSSHLLILIDVPGATSAHISSAVAKNPDRGVPRQVLEALGKLLKIHIYDGWEKVEKKK